MPEPAGVADPAAAPSRLRLDFGVMAVLQAAPDKLGISRPEPCA